MTNYLKEKRANNDVESGITITEVKIAQIIFAFNNSQLINLLKERGNYLIYQQFDKVREVNQKITNIKDE